MQISRDNRRSGGGNWTFGMIIIGWETQLPKKDGWGKDSDGEKINVGMFCGGQEAGPRAG